MSDVDEAYELLVPAGSSPTEAFRLAWESAFEAGRTEFEARAWQIVDADGLAPVPSDIWEALERIARAARNRDMWKAQCERQAEALAAKFAVTDAMEKAGVRHALSDSVHGGSGGWPGYVRRLWGAMNMARLAETPSPEPECSWCEGEREPGEICACIAPTPKEPRA